jgi:formate dehydrogenase alpha subunit
MTNSMDDLETADCILVIGSNTTENHPIVGLRIKKAVMKNDCKLIVAEPRHIRLCYYAAQWMRQKPGTDVALLNGMMNVILSEGLADEAFIAERTEGFEELKKAVADFTPERAAAITGLDSDEIRQAARTFAAAESAAIVYAMGITQHTTGVDNVLTLANLAMLTGNIGRPGTGVNPLRGQNNVQGACDMGGLPGDLTAYQKVADDAARAKFAGAWGVSLPEVPGLTLMEMMDAAHAGDIKALYIVGENPMVSDPDLHHVAEALKEVGLLVVQDIFLTETARMADVVLPAASFAEKDGTFTNTERRVQRVRKAVEAPGNAREDSRIIADLSAKMGYPMPATEAADVMVEIATLTPSYAGISYERLEKGSLQWPVLDAGHPGTPILHTAKFTRGKGLFHAVDYAAAAELPDADYPFILTTGRLLTHYHTGTMTRRVEALEELAPRNFAEINPADAATLGVTDGDMIALETRRGAIRLEAKVTNNILPGVIFVPFHYAEAAANLLTSAELDPVAKIPEYKVCAVRVLTGKDAELSDRKSESVAH